MKKQKDSKKAGAPTPVRVIRIDEACERLAIGRSTLYRWVSIGELPRLRRFGRKVSGFLSDEFDEALAARTEAHTASDMQRDYERVSSLLSEAQAEILYLRARNEELVFAWVQYLNDTEKLRQARLSTQSEQR